MAAQLYFVVAGPDHVGWGFAYSRPGVEFPPERDRAPARWSADACRSYAAPRAEVIRQRLAVLVKPLVVSLAAMAVIALLWLLHASTRPVVALLGAVAATAVLGHLASALLPGAQWSWFSTGALAAAVLVVAMHGLQVVRAAAEDQRTPHDVHRTVLARWHAWLLSGTLAPAILLLAAGFGHELASFLFYPDSGAVWGGARQAGGWGSLLAAGAGAVWTAYHAAPSSRTKDSAESPSLLTRIVFLVAPYLVIAALVVLLAWLGHLILSALAVRPALPQALGDGVLVAASVQCAFALSEIRARAARAWEDASFRLRRMAAVLKFELAFGLGALCLLIAAGGMALGPRVGPRVWVAVLGAVFALVTFALELGWRGRHPRTLGARPRAPRPGRGRLREPGRAAAVDGRDRRRSGRSGQRGLRVHPPRVFWVVGLGWVSDPNLLSMHTFYRGRLVRAYLGASNSARQTQDITDTAPGDAILLRELRNQDQGAPYHLINTTLNLVATRELATAQRLAANFVLSRYYCGSSRTQYCDQRVHGGRAQPGYGSGRLRRGG
jgi:hypothetical protein